VENNGVALVQIGSVGRRPAVCNRAAGLDERLLAKAKEQVFVIVISCPIKDFFVLLPRKIS